MLFILKTREDFGINHGEQRILFNLESTQISPLALSVSFEYLCYESTAIINCLITSVRGIWRSEVCKRQIRPRGEKVNNFDHIKI